MELGGVLGLLVFAGVAGVAGARPPGKGGAGGPAQGSAGLGAATPACAMFLMHAHPGTLKQRLGLSDQQVMAIDGARTSFLSGRIKLQSQIQQNQLRLAELFQAEPPDEQQILALQRRTLALRDAIAEGGVKTYLRLLLTMSRPQRAQFRAQCPAIAQAMGRGGRGMMGRGMGQGMGGQGPMGMGGSGW